jgi:hypothetical protein
MTLAIDTFRQIWCVDFEFGYTNAGSANLTPPGELQVPVCLVALELRSGRKIRRWNDEFGATPPYSTGLESLFIAFFASAEIKCHLALSWPVPARVLDLWVEYRNMTNAIGFSGGRKLIDVLARYGLNSLGADEKGEMQKLAMHIGAGGSYTEEERAALLDYCETDVEALASLLPMMGPRIDLPYAVLRGRYMGAVARMEHAGIPIDSDTWSRLQRHWSNIKGKLITNIDAQYGVYEGSTFKRDLFADYLLRENIPWPRLEDGNLDLSDDAFRHAAKSHPIVSPLRELRHALSAMRLDHLEVGTDGRNRTSLSPFRSVTGRNQPSNNKFIFGPSRWLRGLIKPAPGYGVAYIDWEQQEFGIAAALSGDTVMMEAYATGDPYLSFAQQAGAVPAGATKSTHGPVRELYKQTVLGTQYGLEEQGLADRIGKPRIEARNLLQRHRETYRTFWNWSDAVAGHAMLSSQIMTVFGWGQHIVAYPKEPNPRSIRNFPMQANGAEMMRLAASYATEDGITVCCPIHDAFLIEAPLERLVEDIARMQEVMRRASRTVLAGFELRTEVVTVKYPDRYMDKGGQEFWNRVMLLLEGCENGRGV